MDKLPLVFGYVFPLDVQCGVCGVAMSAAKDEKIGWHYPHKVFDEGCGRCEYEGMKFSVPLHRVRVVK